MAMARFTAAAPASAAADPQRQSSVDGLGESYVAAMSKLASGVVMVTTRIDGKAWGLTVSSCISLSAKPPTLLISLSAATESARSIAEAGWFGASVLGERAVEVARRGAARGEPKFVDSYCDPRPDETAPPLLAGALAHLDCEVTQTLVVADHQLFIGEVREIVLCEEDGEPLLYFARAWRKLGRWSGDDTWLQHW
jgi:flavin reductase (DIM6/NTAB) family NADH-FMN oxidoreductase RutF